MVAEGLGAIGRSEDRFGDIAADLALVDIPCGHDLQVLRPVAAEVPVGEAGAQARDSEVLHPADRFIEPMILPMEPLHDSHLGRVLPEVVERELGRSVFLDQAHVEVPVIG